VRCFIARATNAMSLLATLPTATGRYTGDNAEQVPLVSALKLEARMRRAAKSGGVVEVRDIIGSIVPVEGDKTTTAEAAEATQDEAKDP
jgi:hypothetical protein